MPIGCSCLLRCSAYNFFDFFTVLRGQIDDTPFFNAKTRYFGNHSTSSHYLHIGEQSQRIDKTVFASFSWSTFILAPSDDNIHARSDRRYTLYALPFSTQLLIGFRTIANSMTARFSFIAILFCSTLSISYSIHLMKRKNTAWQWIFIESNADYPDAIGDGMFTDDNEESSNNIVTVSVPSCSIIS